MKTLFRTCVLLIIGLVAVYTAGCGEDIEQEIDPVAVDTESAREESSEPVAADGKPITVTDATFEAVVLEAELPVVLELGAEW
ncbi:hypothetical protein F4009_05035 [Candidatus Poribacteria bacterium]|nr:hypothetical protein [Candidatus Poribacteria bacterium]MYH81838.1 hypothetical protein [Candidatus Poribacteria bacterium]MYK93352.1 hypothetical protein [Candidatus Poribacteria bacterium]